MNARDYTIEGTQQPSSDHKRNGTLRREIEDLPIGRPREYNVQVMIRVQSCIEPRKMYRAVFLCQDSILVGDWAHLHDVSGIELLPEVILALRVLQKSYKIFMLANYPDRVHEAATSVGVDQLQGHVLNRLAQYGIYIKRIPPSRWAAEGNIVTRPLPCSLIKAAREYEIDVHRSFVISDRPHEIELADQAGARGIYIAGERKAQSQLSLTRNCLIAANLWDAALFVMEQDLSQRGQGILPDVEHAAVILRDGGVVAFPTETVYGLGANALDPMAVARIFEIKGRPRFDPLIVHVAALRQVKDLVTELPEQAQELMRFFWPGPLTIVLPKSDLVPDIVTAGLPTVAIRMPDHPIALTLIRKSGVPVAAPSANLFGHVSPTTADHVRQQLGDRVDRVLDGGRCAIGVESTVISVSGGIATLLRPGGTPLEEIEHVIGPVQRRTKVQATPMSPGQLPYHYAPRTPLVLKGQNLPEAALRCGLLSFTVPTSAEGFVAVEVLSAAGDLREAAANLFAALHRLDAMQLDLIVAELVPEVGLGLAINDRLRRAAQKRSAVSRQIVG